MASAAIERPFRYMAAMMPSTRKLSAGLTAHSELVPYEAPLNRGKVDDRASAVRFGMHVRRKLIEQLIAGIRVQPWLLAEVPSELEQQPDRLIGSDNDRKARLAGRFRPGIAPHILSAGCVLDGIAQRAKALRRS